MYHASPICLTSFSPANFSLIRYRQLIPYIVRMGTPSFRRAILDLMPWKTIQKIKEIVDMLHNISQDIYRSKIDALKKGDEFVSQQIGQGKDIMSVLRKYSFFFVQGMGLTCTIYMIPMSQSEPTLPLVWKTGYQKKRCLVK